MKAAMSLCLSRLVRSDKKAWYKLIDLEASFKYLFHHAEAWIVDDAYFVVFDVHNPWYAKEDILILEEVIVLRLVRGSDFSVVPAFLERKGDEAGVKLVCAGTALARNDMALASFYERHGFKLETMVLTKQSHAPAA